MSCCVCRSRQLVFLSGRCVILLVASRALNLPVSFVRRVVVCSALCWRCVIWCASLLCVIPPYCFRHPAVLLCPQPAWFSVSVNSAPFDWWLFLCTSWQQVVLLAHALLPLCELRSFWVLFLLACPSWRAPPLLCVSPASVVCFVCEPPSGWLFGVLSCRRRLFYVRGLSGVFLWCVVGPPSSSPNPVSGGLAPSSVVCLYVKFPVVDCVPNALVLSVVCLSFVIPVWCTILGFFRMAGRHNVRVVSRCLGLCSAPHSGR